MRPIDADALKKENERLLHCDFPYLSEITLEELIDEAPTIDAVPVIRCKDCKYAKKVYIKNLPWLKQWEYSCGYFNKHLVIGDGFCSNAEPKVTE